MSQMVTRKRTGGDEKEKRQSDSPVKDMKKKMAANAEKEKNAAEKVPEKNTEKQPEKPAEKPADKPAEKSDKKPADKAPEKPVEKKVEKPAEKKSDAQNEKKSDGKGESSAKTDKPDHKKADTRDKPKQNGSSNGVNGTVKVTRTPETPRPASGKQAETGDESKDTRVLKLSQEPKAGDAPKPDTRKSEPKTDTKKSDAKSDTKKDAQKPDSKQESPKVDTKKSESKEVSKEAKEATKDAQGPPKEEAKEAKEAKSDKVEVEVVVDIEHSSEPGESRKPDTNFSKSRVKVSPYRRSLRLADQTTSSVQANYTGNNTTMEMDITESSSILEGTLDDSSYLGGLRSIKGRRSYKPLQEMTLRHTVANRSQRSVTSVTASDHSRPTGTVVGRKRKPDADDISVASEAIEAGEADEAPVAGKRQRLLDRIARPFRRSVAPQLRSAEIVGINTDLPLTAPVASTVPFDPEALKPADVSAPAPPQPEDSKRCVVM